MLAPSGLTVNSLEAERATISWNNALFTQNSFVGLYQGTTHIASLTVEGNSCQLTGLLPQTTYTVYVYNRFGDIQSMSPATKSFTTLSSMNYVVNSRVLASTDTFGTDTICGFEVMNGVTYVARYDASGIKINNYNAAGSPIDPELFISAPNLTSSNAVSFTAGGGNIFVQYTDGIAVNIACYNASMTLVTQGPVADVPLYAQNQLVYASGKLFSMGSITTFGEIGYDAVTDLRVFSSPTTMLATSTLVARLNHSLSNDPSGGYSAKICADSQYLYCARLDVDINGGASILVDKIPLSVTGPTAPTAVCKVYWATDQIYQFACGGGQLYLKLFLMGPSEDAIMTDCFINLQTLYPQIVTNPLRGDYGVDLNGRLWMGEYTTRSYVQLASQNAIENSVQVSSFPEAYGPILGGFLKTDTQTGSFNMLHWNSSGFLAVYYYQTAY